MKRFVRLAALATLPLALIVSVAQARKVDALRREAAALESTQRDLIEAKRRLFASIALLSTRERVETAAKGDPEASRPAPAAPLRILITSEDGIDG